MTIFNRLQKVVASVSIASFMLMFAVVPAQAANLGFTDDAQIPSWADEAIMELMDQGVLSGNDDGSFAPNRQLNRAEVAKMIVLAANLDIDTTGGPHFPDVQPGAWYYDYIETMYNYGFINGYPDGLFRPGVGINRAEIAKMVVNAFEIEEDLSGAPHFSDVKSSDWFYGYVETAYNNNIISAYSDGTYGPNNAVTRAETAVIVYNGQWVGFGSGNNGGLSEGTLEVSLSQYTPRGTNIPFNATSVPYTTVELTSSDDKDVSISSITWTRLGLGDNDDFDNVWLEIDGFKVGNDKSVNNDDIVELRFNPAVVVPAGQTLLADLVASAKFSTNDQNLGHINRFALISADDINSSAANIVGDFPIEGAEMEISNYEVSEFEFTTLGSASTVNVGDQFVEIGKFRLLNRSESNKDVEFRAITFKNDGTSELENVLDNVALYVSGERVSSEEIIDGDYITFRLDNGVTGGYIIEDGDSKIFSLRADIVSAEQGDTINFKVDNHEDIVAIEIGTSFGVRSVASNGNNAEEDDARLSTYTIDSGDLNVSRDPSSLGNQEYSAGSNDIVAMTARVTVDQPLLVDGIKLRIGDGSAVADKGSNGVANELADFASAFDNFRLFLNDQLLDSTNDIELRAGGANGTVTDYRLNFDTTFEIAGTSVLKLVINIEDAAQTGDKIKFEVAGTDFDSPEYISTGDNVPASQLLGLATSSFVEVEQSVLTITRVDGFANGETIVAGVDDVTFMTFVLDANDSGDLNVTSISADAAATGAAAVYTNFTAAIFVDGVRQGSARNLESDGTVTFNDLSVVIPSSGQKEFTLVVDTIEASASGAAVVTTLENPDASLALARPIGAGQQFMCVANPAGVVIGNVIAVSNDGTIFGLNAEVRTVTGLAGNVCSSGSSIDFAGAAFTNSHQITEKWSNTSATYGAGATQVKVADASRFSVGQQVNIGALGANPFTITVISGNLVTLNQALGAIVATDGSITMTPVVAGDTIAFNINSVDVDNIENGQEVETFEDGVVLSSANKLAGAQFNLIKAGTLSVGAATTIYSDILIAGQQDKEVLQFKLQAADDEVRIRDLFFVNDLDNNIVAAPTAAEQRAGDRMVFKLYNGAGQLVQTKYMTNGRIHFELPNSDQLLVPKDGTVNATVKVSINNNINDAADTGAQLRLRLDDRNANGKFGLVAVTSATGSDLVAADNSQGSSAGAAPAAGFGSITGQPFVAYKSEISIAHNTDGVWSKGPNANAQNVYKFTVKADSAAAAELSRVTLQLAIAGIQKAGPVAFVPADFGIFGVNSNGTVDTNAQVGTIAVTGATAAGTEATLTIDFANEQLNAGESRSYMLRMANTENNAGALSDDDSLSVQIVRDTNYSAAGTLANMQANGAGDVDGDPTNAANADAVIIWSDQSANLSGSNDYLNGYLLEIDSNSALQQD